MSARLLLQMQSSHQVDFNAGLLIRKEGSPQERMGLKLMLLNVLWVIIVSAAIVVFFRFYLAVAYLLFSPLFDYGIEQRILRRLLKRARRLTISSPVPGPAPQKPSAIEGLPGKLVYLSP
jgi:hypothetical protein